MLANPVTVRDTPHGTTFLELRDEFQSEEPESVASRPSLQLALWVLGCKLWRKPVLTAIRSVMRRLLLFEESVRFHSPFFGDDSLLVQARLHVQFLAALTRQTRQSTAFSTTLSSLTTHWQCSGYVRGNYQKPRWLMQAWTVGSLFFEG